METGVLIGIIIVVILILVGGGVGLYFALKPAPPSTPASVSTSTTAPVPSPSPSPPPPSTPATTTTPTTTTPPTCPSGYITDPTNSALCMQNCQPGYTFDGTSLCNPIPQTPNQVGFDTSTCKGTGQYVLGSQCITCPQGLVLDANNNCMPPNLPSSVQYQQGVGYYVGATTGTLSCPSGQDATFSQSGQFMCVPSCSSIIPSGGTSIYRIDYKTCAATMPNGPAQFINDVSSQGQTPSVATGVLRWGYPLMLPPKTLSCPAGSTPNKNSGPTPCAVCPPGSTYSNGNCLSGAPYSAPTIPMPTTTPS